MPGGSETAFSSEVLKQIAVRIRKEFYKENAGFVAIALLALRLQTKAVVFDGFRLWDRLRADERIGVAADFRKGVSRYF